MDLPHRKSIFFVGNLLYQVINVTNMLQKIINIWCNDKYFDTAHVFQITNFIKQTFERYCGSPNMLPYKYL